MTSLRTSHIAWFRMCGYRYVFSNEGLFVASVLRGFYEKFIEPRRGPDRRRKGSLMSVRVKREVDECCLQFANLIRPLPESSLAELPEAIRQGTPETGWFMALWDEDQVYGKISVVKLGNQRVGVLTPIITDARGWALIDLIADLELVYSVGKFDAEVGQFRFEPPGRRAIWPRVEEVGTSLRPVSIRDAAQAVIDSGRMV